ncbi:hypothetical protein ACJMK2_012027 [Sinanodonta woodiana]|uniref:EGF-like domain-containing protein n=1 Tax=Sinanodonta woodiana TaxID=1069815 RepID=A0ABD3V822_SINWO
MVHIHPEDQEEVLTLKKVLASTLSVKVKISNESTWDYISNERDHLGDLTHEYRSVTTSNGLTLRRYHRSLDKIERIHEKITQMDNRGTIHSVESEDSYIMEDRLRKDYETKRQPYPEEYIIKTSMEGDIGIIKANSKTTMRLVGKRRTKVEDVHHGLIEDDLIVKQKAEERLTLKNISDDVIEALRCIHNYTDKGHTNRTVCVNRLRQKVLKLQTEDYEILAGNFLNRTCDHNNTKCIDEKYLFTDIVARAGDPFSQRLILKFLLSDKQRDDEVLRRIFIHLSVIEHPIQETIAVVEKICFGEQDSHHTKGKIILTETQRRACLCLGSMAKAINSKGNNTEAERLMDKIHTWLYTQGDVTPEHLRPKRYIMVADDSVSDDHLLSKVVLLHSLGNAGLQSSISHLKTFAQPNTRQSAWRRAALTSLRHYGCHESATILLTSILHDETESVRQVAWIEYGQHPKRNNLTTEQHNLIFSRKYTYETVMRARREASLDTVLVEFKVELPEVHWGKSVGNSEIGASFGVDMVNKLHIRLQPLSGFLRVNIFDRIYAEAHVGLLGLEVDILKIVACYKGKIEYNMNVLKNFAYGKDQELYESFNAAADEIIGPIIQSVKGMSDNFKSSSGESTSVFASLSDSIRDIPLQTKKFLEASIKLTSLLDRFHGLPLISRAKYVAFKLQSLAEDIKNDALIFYQTVSDAGLVTLHHAEEQLTEATNSIVEAQKKIGESPRQAFEILSAAKKRITVGMQQILEAKSKMSEALSGHGGSLPGWLSSQEETKMLTDAVQTMLLKVKSKINNYEATNNDDGTDLVDFSSLKNIEEALQDCLRELHFIYDASEPFLKAFTYTMRKVEDLKQAVELIDKATKASQRKVLANFGATFHPKFPSQRRGTDRNCGKGTWHSTAGGMYNDTPGIDVIVDLNEKVPCPVSGYVMRTCTPDEILIIPSGDHFKGYEVLIRNIIPSSKIPFDTGIVMNAGEELGVGRGKGICDDSYIHVAIRQREGSEKSCSYIDPSSFVDNPKPFPKWQQECKEFTFKHIGEIIEAGLTGKGFADLIGKLIKRAVAWAAAAVIDKISTAFPNNTFVQMTRQFSLAYLSKYNTMIAKVFLNGNKDQSSGLRAACGEQSTTTQPPKVLSPPKPPGDEQNNPSVSERTLSETFEALGNDTSDGANRLQAMKSAIQNLQNAASELPMENMAAMPFLRYGQILTRLDVPSRGGKQSMPTMFQMLLWKACPTFENGLVQGYGHICIPLEGCRGLNCSISIPFGITTSKLPVMVMFDLDAMVFRIDVKNESISVPVSENPVNFHLRQTIFSGYTAILVSQASNITINLGHAYQLTQTMHLCDAELTCLQNVGIFHDLTFFQHRGRVERSADGKCTVSIGANFEGHGKVSADLDIDSNGHIAGGGINTEINVGDNGKITGGFHGSTDGTWHTDLGTELDLGDGTNFKGSVEVDGNKDGKVSYGVGVEAQFGDKGSIGGFVKGNSDGEITAGMQGSVKIGNDTIKAGGWIQHDRNGTQGGGVASVDFNGKGSISASVNASSDGTINAGIGGEMKIGNTSIQAEGHIHHDHNGTGGGISAGAQFGNDGHLKASLEGNSNGEITGGLEGDMKLGNGSSVHGALYVHHDKNGTSGGGMLSGDFGRDGHFQASVNRSSSGAIDAGLGGQLNMGNTTINGEAHIHHDQNGTSGGGSLSAQLGNNNSLAASVEGNSDGTIKGQIEGTVHVGNGTFHGAGYVQHDSNGTSGGGMLSGDFGRDGHFQASVNRSSSGAIDAGLGGQLNMGNTTINGEAHIHHDQNGTSGGGSLSAQLGNNNSLAASVEGNSDGTIKGQIEGTVHVGNGTFHGAGYVQHDSNGTSGGGMLSGDFGRDGHFQASVNRSSSGAIDAGLGGQLNMGNTSIKGEAHIHHDQNGTSGGGSLSAQLGNNNSLAASVEGNSDGTIKGQIEGTVHMENGIFHGAGYVQHDSNGTSGGGVLSGDLGRDGHFQASVNRSSSGAIDGELEGQLNMGNTNINGEAHIHHDQNGTSGGGSLSAQLGNNNSLAASVEGNSDGTIKGQIEGTVHVGNGTFHGAGYVQHDSNGTSGGGVLSGDFGRDGHFQASVNRSSSGAIDAGLGGQLNMGNTSINGEAHIHHDQNGTSGGGSLSAQLGNNNSLAASVEGNSDGTIKGQVKGEVHMENGTFHGSGHFLHDRNETSGGGMLSADFGRDGNFQASVNRSNSGAIDAVLGGQLNMGNTSIKGEVLVHHDQNETMGFGALSAQFRNNNSLDAYVEGNPDGTIKGHMEGTVHVRNGTFHAAGYMEHSQNGTTGWIDTLEKDAHASVPSSYNAHINATTLSNVSKGVDEPNSGLKDNNVTKDIITGTNHRGTRSSETCSFGMTGNFDASGKFNGLGVGATIPGFGKVGANIKFQDGQVVGDISIGDFKIPIPSADMLNLGQFSQLFAEHNLDKDDIFKIQNNMNDGIRHKLVTVEKDVSLELRVDTYEEDAPARDKKDGVEYKDRHVDITIFSIGWTFEVGPIGLRLEFGAGGAIGMSMWSDVRANSGATTFSIGPWVSGMVWGGISLELGIASGGLKLIGYILKTKFPITEETQQGKHPVTVVMKIDLELTPIELSLRGWAKVFGAKVFDKRLWSWACEPITWNILTKKFVDNDQDPPQFINGGFCGNTTRSKRSVDECSVKQLIGRHPTDPAFQIVVYTNDDNSVVTQFYGIGTYSGGTDVVSWTEFRGSTQIVPMQLPNGIPLYFTIKAENSQGLKSYLKCKLNTYDTTLPGGRVEASHPFTSIPNQIAGTVIVMEDSPVIEAYHALGYSPGEYGTQVASWQTLTLGYSDLRKTMNSDLKYFSNPREGRLSASPVKVLQIKHAEGCASQCKQYGPKCMSFDFEETSESCNFHDAIEGGPIKLHIDGRYKNYERLDVGYTAYISYTDIQVQHGAMYYINAFIKNALHYVSVLHSGGTMADFTPPEPGNIGRPAQDVMEAIGCNASVIQRCEQVTWLPNHRKIIDGSDGTTIFNGHKPLQEVKFTISNHYISANWDGFHDEESGIYGFTWASGTNVCGTNILKYTDPHAHLSSSKFWTYSGYATDLHLPDGQYYVTIQAVNNVVFGGAMVTTVCHSTPVTVDTTPPVFFDVSDVMYDEDFDILAVYYNVSDPLSGILRVDFGLGRTKHDVELRGYSRHNYMVRDDPFLVIDNLDLEPGIPAWIRLRAVNNVELFGSGHSNEPIMVDKTPPLPGKVLDGDVLGQDREYQHDTDTICSQWIYFYDPESGINQFIWGVGTAPGKDNIIPYRNLSSTTKRSCHAAELKHNVTYYSTIIAYNDALNAKMCNSSSNGILVDTTPPKGGTVIDVGSYENTMTDIAFSSESATVKASWTNFSDAESSIASYTADIYINREHVKTIHAGTDTNVLDHSLSLKHLDNVYIDVLALNGADLWVRAASDGFLVDHTPPNVIFLEDSINGKKYQSDKSKLSLRWDFEDAESGIAEYRYVVNELYMGRHSAIVPRNGKFETLIPSAASQVNLDLHTLNLLDGALYTVQVTALNKARLSSSHESSGIIIDTSPPSLSKVHIGRPMDEEELDELGHVLHASQSSITVSWRAFDPESGIEKVMLAIGTIPGNMTGSDGSLTITSDDSVAELSGLKLQPTTGNDSIYYVSVQVINKAGLKSSVEHSKPIKILKANVAGTVYDGTTELEDIDFSSDVTTVTMSFNGFESEACNIIGYEWAIGFVPYGSDVLPFTDYGIVMINDTFGHAQINIQLYDNQLYFSTVRARTGHNCHEQYIVSTSDGFKVDTTGPRIDFIVANNTYTSEAAYDLFKTSYQDQTDSIYLTWNVTDLSGVNDVIVSVGHLPYSRDKYNLTETKSNTIKPGDVKLQPGEAVFVNILTTDMSGLRTELSSPAIVTDVSSPEIHDFVCTDYISVYKTLLTCTWSKVEEYESSITSMSFAIGTKSLSFDIANFTNIPLDRFEWTRDMHSFIGRDNVRAIFTAFRVQNILGLRKVLEFKTVVDKTPPVGGNLIFTTQMGGTKDIRRELCQIPTSYVEVNATEPVDEESSVERYEIALGTSAGGTDILSFKPASSVHSLFLGDLALPIGSTVFASMKAYNRAGLYSVVNSDGIVVSPHPLLTVNDGPGEEDLDFQSKMSVIEGNWHYSDPCPVVSAEWSVVDLTGKVLQNFTAIAGARNHFYNDELSTENGFTYISIVRIEDAIGRTYTAETDGITIRIQTPSPGYINDGLEQDINFQILTTELSANWGGFGDPTSDSPVQKISHYEVAIGNDRRFEKTRTNVHFFVNVGLNTSYTFTKLNLTKKIVQYYVTVRAYSHAGSFEEVYSNGIRVGYHEGVVAGNVQHNRYEHTTNRVVVSWDGFSSDYGIRQYQVGISSNNTLPLNETMECKVFYQRYSRTFDVQSLMSVGTNTYTALENLTLQHDKTYYVTVVATDESGMCIAMNAGPLTIDTTPPSSGTLIFDGTSDHVNFVTDERSMHISWMGFEDEESGIQYFNISLMSGSGCSQNEMFITDSIIQSVTVYNLTETTFYNLNLERNHAYYVTLLAVNGAELKTKITSVPILLDTTYTYPGTVKIGYDWFHEIAIQSSLTEIGITLAVARDEESHKCPHQEEIISPTTKLLPNSWMKLRQEFSPFCVIDGEIPIKIQVRHSDDLTNVVKGGISSEIMSIRQGLYSFVLTGLSGENMFASLAVASSIESIPSNITHLIEREEFSKNFSLNSTNEEESGQNAIGPEDQYGAGFLIPGFLVDNHTCYCLVWAKDMYKFEVKFIQLDMCADKVATEYGIDLEHVNISTGMTWQAKFLINGVEKITINSLHFKDTVTTFVYGFNDNDYIPPVRDPFNPFETKIRLNSIKVPVSTDKPCMYGTGFYDGESSIKEIWIGISNSLNETGNVREMKLEKKFCLSCNERCPMVCDPNCTHDSPHAFDIMSFNIRNLSLVSSSNISAQETGDTQRADNSTGFDILHANSYFINVRILNFAGLATNVNSKAVIIDDTPPIATYVICADPIHNQDEPSVFQGTNSSMAAFWDFHDDISQIMGYTVSIGSRKGSDDIVSNMALGLRKSVVIHNLTDYLRDNETYFITVTATNEAKLKTSASCNITIDLNVPDVAGSGAVSLFSIDVTDGPPNVTFLESSESIGVDWKNDDPDVEFFEMQIGSKQGVADILPRVKIGTKKSKKAAVINGHLWLDNVNINANVKQFVLKNWTNESLNEAKRHGGYFHFEPGRCLNIGLYAISRSHLSSKIPVHPMCIKRNSDVVISFEKVMSHSVIRSGNALKVSKANSTDFRLSFKGLSGGLTVGLLQNSDWDSLYGSAASSDFKPYVSSPETPTRTSRLLKKRILKYSGSPFFVAPVGETMLADYINVSLNFNKTEFEPGITIPVLAEWNDEAEMWQAVHENCIADENIDYDSSIYKSKICLPGINFAHRNKRGALSSSQAVGPRMFALFVVNKTLAQSTPHLITNEMFCVEDGFQGKLQLQYTDEENDSVTFQISHGPEKGNANITEDGVLYYKPNKDFAGDDTLTVMLTETSLPYGSTSKPSEQVIHIVVKGVNDPPLLFLLLGNETINAKYMQHVSKNIEANSSLTQHVIGTYIAVDIDEHDNLSLLTRFDDDNGINVTMNDADDAMADLLSVPTAVTPRTVKTFDFTINMSAEFYGIQNYSVRIIDNANTYSLPITLTINVMINPCVFGTCQVNPEHNISCTDLVRTTSFEFFSCFCKPGYHGQWCHLEIDECSSNPCPVLYDCHDLVNDYKCTVNILHLLLIILSAAIVVALLCILLYRRIKSSKAKLKVFPSRCELENPLDQYEQSDFLRQRWQDGMLYQGRKLMDTSFQNYANDPLDLPPPYQDNVESQDSSHHNRDPQEDNPSKNDIAYKDSRRGLLDPNISGSDLKLPSLLPVVGSLGAPHHRKLNLDSGKLKSAKKITPIDV